MEQFEKWWEQQEWHKKCIHHEGEAVWRAALEWVVYKMNIIYADDMAIHTLGPIIKKELGDT